MRLEEQRVQGIEAGRLAMLVGGAEHVDAVADVLDAHAAAGEAADIVQAQSGQLHQAAAAQ
jgi:cobalamin synthase